MSTAYVVEILKPEAGGKFPTRYLRHDGAAQEVPDIFVDIKFVTHALLAYVKTLSDESEIQGTFIELTELERGLRNCHAKRTPLHDVYQNLKPLPGDAPNTIWKIQLPLDTANAEFGTTIAFDGTTSAAGRQWDKAGMVRSYLSKRIGEFETRLQGAQIVRIEYQPDLITPKSVQRFDLKRFYLDSDYSPRTYERWMKTEAALATTPVLDALVEAPLPSDPQVVKDLTAKPITPNVSNAVEWRF